MKRMKKQPISTTFALALILLNALTWLVLGIIIGLDIHPGLPDMPGMKTVLAILSIAIALILLGLTFFVWKHKRAAYYLILTFFLVTSILTIFDDIGWADLVFLFISLMPVVLLIKDQIGRAHV